MSIANNLRTKLTTQLKTHEIDSKDELRQYVIDIFKKVNEVLAGKSNQGAFSLSMIGPTPSFVNLTQFQ